MRVFLIAGEASGDKLGAALMAGLHQLAPGVTFDGVGGPLMAAQGLVSRFPMQELSVMGLAEVLPKYRALKARIRECAAAVIDTRPDVLITIDSPDFGLRVAGQVRAAAPDVATVHYVAPSVWAWRPGRAARMARSVDHVLALLPFEPPYMQAAGMSCDFVGHPVVAETWASPAEGAAFRAAHGIATDAPLLMTLPGSRRGEVARLAPVFGQVAGNLAARHPGLRVVLPTLPVIADQVRALTGDWPVSPLIITQDADRRAAFAAADVALAASGTVSLELAANRLPMVIAYDMAWLTRLIMSWLIRVDTVTLVNLVSESRAIPECLGANCTAACITPKADALLAGRATGRQRTAGAKAAEATAETGDPGCRNAVRSITVDDTGAPSGAADAIASRQAAPPASDPSLAWRQQISAMDLTMQRLGQGGPPPGLRAARSVLDFLAARTRAE
ncbi:lipid-A-disaccharide synthase [Paracoccus sp. p4-l81]|uniref:lipid-A-disaccharide synthase n=1 Tax=unclassified Paracoccus (in: a-proteobacteria) TaxID=2688777 RepID=UPI0035B9A441